MCCGTIKFSIKKAEMISLKIYDSNEKFVNEILNGNLGEGSYQIIWDGKDNFGNNVTKGIYYYQLDNSEKLKIIGPIFIK